ncbi:unnamed protein product (macronuclear) [Paramecium tetraurelia]|uniref:Multifunctional methyltransferase subunit TRM112-like protein n=2 Tax=Paramecium TaxID=5884 RepID=A0DBG9_PARTE|nr:uncharacterized protein GSPATT00015281001 [Paramecium tetraurelia]CAD8160393.1 unnamed protein product [Paramecium octaurelia]CAK80386.1 unnamed protein product [Paramecium tetraurelia]|eukprot:XP_001447783.1 hypothetical protein (macronuclear) [Paramecium tetraurelia strain d4-2]
MRLLVHNLLMCNKCDKNNYPLKIEVNKSVIMELEFKKDAILKLIPKLDFEVLSNTVRELGFKQFPKQIPPNVDQDLVFLKDLHRVLFETHIMDGQLTCPNPSCKRNYPITNGIPNMILTEDEQ